jgi:predicted RNA methylase
MVNYKDKYLKYKLKYKKLNSKNNNKSVLKNINDALEKLNNPNVYGFTHKKYDTIYGELLPNQFSKIFDNIVEDNDVFVDLGSGRGILSIYMILKYGIQSIGIEIIKERYDVSVELSKILLNNQQNNLLKLIQGDFFRQKLDKGTIFYCDNTMFTEELDKNLINYILRQKKKKSINVLIFKKPVIHHKLKEFKQINIKTTYLDNTNVYLYKTA